MKYIPRLSDQMLSKIGTLDANFVRMLLQSKFFDVERMLAQSRRISRGACIWRFTMTPVICWRWWERMSRVLA